MSEEELNMIVRNADVDKDGVVTLDDFRALVAAQQRDLQSQSVANDIA